MSEYNHYIKINENNIIIDGYVDWQEDKRNVDEIQLTGDFGRHFQIQLINEKGQFLYKWESDAMILREQSELDTEWNNRPTPPPNDNDRITFLEDALLSILLGG